MPAQQLRFVRPMVLVALLSGLVSPLVASFPQSEVLLPDTVYVTVSARQGDRLLLGSTSAGVWSYDLRRRQLADEGLRELAGRKITALTVGATADEYWVGTYFDGLFQVRGRRVTRFARDAQPGLPSDRITALFHGGDALWIGTQQGLALLQGGTIRKVLDEDVKCLAGDETGRRIWAGHPQGRVSMIENGLPRTVSAGLPGNPTLRSLTWNDTWNALLLGTFSGLFRSGPRLEGLVHLSASTPALRLVNMLVTRQGRSFFSVPGRKGGIREIKADGSFVDTFNSYQGYSEAADMHLWPEGEFVIISFGKLWHLTRELQTQGLAAVEIRRSLGFDKGRRSPASASPSYASPSYSSPSSPYPPSPAGRALPPRIGQGSPAAALPRRSSASASPSYPSPSSPSPSYSSPSHPSPANRAEPPRIGQGSPAAAIDRRSSPSASPSYSSPSSPYPPAPAATTGSRSPVVSIPGITAVAATLGRIWFGSASGELHSWNPDGRDRLERRFSGAIAALHVAPGGLWIATERGEVFRFNGFAYRPVPLPAGPDGAPGAVSAVASTGRRTWFATDRGLFLYDGDTGSWAAWGARELGLRSARFHCLAVDGSERVWAGCDEGLLVGGAEGWRLHGEANGLPRGAVRAVTVDLAGEIWCGTDGAAAHWNGREWERFPGVTARWLRATRSGEVLAGGNGLRRLRAGSSAVEVAAVAGIPFADGAETVRGLVLGGPQGLFLVEER